MLALKQGHQTHRILLVADALVHMLQITHMHKVESEQGIFPDIAAKYP